MTERFTEGPEILIPPDPEIEAISDKLRVITESLGFSELGVIGQRRAQFLREVNIGRGFDRDNPVHIERLGAYQDAGIDSYRGSPNLNTVIGYHIAMARLWLEADNPDGFYDYMYGYEDDPSDRGAITVLRDTPGLEDIYEEVRAVLEYLQSLNTNQPEA